jgi:hypothetical protein
MKMQKMSILIDTERKHFMTPARIIKTQINMISDIPSFSNAFDTTSARTNMKDGGFTIAESQKIKRPSILEAVISDIEFF